MDRGFVIPTIESKRVYDDVESRLVSEFWGKFPELVVKIKAMDIDTLQNTPDPASLGSAHLKALWYDLNDDWDTAHSIVQQMSDPHAMWIHAYLHRKEPDIWNAKYWYNRCGKPFPGDISFEVEAMDIISVLS